MILFNKLLELNEEDDNERIKLNEEYERVFEKEFEMSEDKSLLVPKIIVPDLSCFYD